MNSKYNWLFNEKAPKILVQSLALLGTTEIPGPKNDETIMSWAKELGLKAYTNDEIPWCGLVMAIIVKRAGYDVVKEPLWALNWNNFGERVYQAQLGDVLTFKRTSGGHVGIYVGEDSACYHILGGNQGNTHTISRIEKGRLSQIRRPVFKIGKPANVRKIVLAADGVISKNEA